MQRPDDYEFAAHTRRRSSAHIEPVAQVRRRPLSKRARRAIMAGAVLGLIGIAGAASSQSTWPIPLLAFTPDTPAVASEVNGNFRALRTGIEQVVTWIELKIGPLSSPGITASGSIMNDVPGSTYDLWIQGSTAPSGSARNLALLGDSVNDRLILNMNGEYTGGLQVYGAFNLLDGPLTARFGTLAGADITSTTRGMFNPLAVTTTSGTRALLMDDDEILVSDAQPLYIQGDGSTGAGGPTQIGGNVTVLGSLTVNGPVESGSRYVETARRFDDLYLQAGVANSVAAIDMVKLESLCSDYDGCTIRLIMKDYDASEQDASVGPVHFEYDTTTRVYRSSEGTFPQDTSRSTGTNNNNVTEHPLRAWNCYFTDSQYIPGSGGAVTDNTTSMYVMSFNHNTAYRPDCVLVIDD